MKNHGFYGNWENVNFMLENVLFFFFFRASKVCPSIRNKFDENLVKSREHARRHSYQSCERPTRSLWSRNGLSRIRSFSRVYTRRRPHVIWNTRSSRSVIRACARLSILFYKCSPPFARADRWRRARTPRIAQPKSRPRTRVRDTCCLCCPDAWVWTRARAARRRVHRSLSIFSADAWPINFNGNTRFFIHASFLLDVRIKLSFRTLQRPVQTGSFAISGK